MTEYVEQTIRIGDYQPAPYNPRQISEHDLTNLKESIARWGDLENVVVNKRTGHIVSGHQRLRAAQDGGREEFRAVVIDVDEAEEKLINLAMNRIRGEWDEPRLAEMFAGMAKDGVDLKASGFTDAEIDLFSQPFVADAGLGESDSKGVVVMTFRLTEAEVQEVTRALKKYEAQAQGRPGHKESQQLYCLAQAALGRA